MTTESAVAHPALTTFSDDEIAFRDAVAGFATDEVKPRVAQMERAGKIDPVPVTKRPLSAANDTLNDLREGKIVGRVVLTP